MKIKWFEKLKKISAWVVIAQMLFALIPTPIVYAGVWSIGNVSAYNFSNGNSEELDGSNLDATDYPDGFDVRLSFSDPGNSGNCTQFILDGSLVAQDNTEPFQMFGIASNFDESLFTDGPHTLVVKLYTSNDCNGNPKDISPDIDFETNGFYPVPDITAPAVPTGLGFESVDRLTSYACGTTITLQPVVPVWGDNTEEDFDHYEYTSFHPNGSIGLDEMVLTESEFFNTWMPPADGVYGYAVRAVDKSDNRSDWALSAETLAGSCQIIYDSEDYPTAPTITTPVNGQYFQTAPILNDWTPATDSDGICQYRIEYVYEDGHLFVGGPYRYTNGTTTERYHSPAITEQGGVTIRVQGIDCEGHDGLWSNSVHYHYDATAPTAPVISGFNNPNISCGVVTNTHNVTVQWSDSFDASGVAGYNYEIDYPLPGGGRGLWSPFFPTPPNSSQYTGSLNEGTHYIRVRAMDNAGLYSGWSNICSITADWTAPDVTIETPANGAVLSGTNEIRGNVVDDNPHHYWFVVQGPSGVINLSPDVTGTINDSNSFTNKLLSTWDTTNFPDGVYTIKLEARDAANNKDSGSVDWHTVTVDNTRPTVDIDYYLGTGATATGFKVVFSEDVKEAEAENPANYYLTNWPDFAASSGDLVGDASIVYDSTTRTATVTFSNPGWYVSPEQLWGVQNVHDLADNLQLVNPYEEYSTPLQDPVTGAFPSGIMGLDGDYVSNVQVDLVAYDPAIGSGVKQTFYSLDGLLYFPGNSFTFSEEGFNDFWFYSTDWAGNVEDIKYGFLTIDKVGPIVEYVEPPTPEDGAVINVDEFDVKVQTEGADSCEIYVVGEGFEDDMTPDGFGGFTYSFGDVPEGPHDYFVICFDENGNSTTAEERTITVDETPPVLTLVGANPLTITIGGAYTDPGATASDNEDGDITGDIIISGDTVNPGALGSYTIRYNVTDSAGNHATEITRVVNVVALPDVPVPLTPFVTALGVPAALAAPAVAGATVEPEEVLAATGEVKGAEEEDIKGSSKTTCPWWWIIVLVLIVVLAFIGGIVRSAKEDSILRRYFYLWPPVLAGLAWLLHLWLHNDYGATWFCNNYWFLMLLAAVVGELVFSYLISRRRHN